MAASFNSADATVSSINGSGGPDKGSVKEPSWILFVSGPTGAGKSSVAKFLASRLGAHFLEGDDVQSPGYSEYVKNLVANGPIGSFTQKPTSTKCAEESR